MNMPTERVTHKEHDHIVHRPNGTIVEDIDIEEEVERVAGGTSHPASHASGTVPVLESVAEIGTAPTMATRINPRTGKPLSIPKPLSLTPQEMSPIVPVNVGGGQLIREVHEEVSRDVLLSRYRDMQIDRRPFDKAQVEFLLSSRPQRGHSTDLMETTEQLLPMYLQLLVETTQSYATLPTSPILVLSTRSTSRLFKVPLSMVNQLPKSSPKSRKVTLPLRLSIRRLLPSPRLPVRSQLLSLPILLETELGPLSTPPTMFLEPANLEKLPSRYTIPIIRKLSQSLRAIMSRKRLVAVLLVLLVHLSLLWSSLI